MITLTSGNRFTAPINAPYVDELRKAYWHRDDYAGIYYTTDPARVAPVVKYLSPELQQKILGQESGYEDSMSLSPKGLYDIPYPKDGPTPFPFQLASVEYILQRESVLLAEDAGLGKSCIMTLVSNTMQARNVLILCPAIAKYNWLTKEWPKWNTQKDLTCGVVDGSEWVDTDVVIINYDILVRHKKKIQSRVWDLLLIDESHRIKNKDAKRTKMVLGGTLKTKQEEAILAGLEPGKKRGYYKVPAIPYKKRIFATATPLNRPKDLWTMAEACDPKGLGANWMTYHRRYCNLQRTPFGYNVNGANNLTELGARMRTTFMVRHDPKILNLPPLREPLYLLPPVEIIISEEENFVHDNLDALMGLAKAAGSAGYGMNEGSSPEEFLKLIGEVSLNNSSLIGKPEFVPLFSKFALIREKTGLAKVDSVVKFVNNVTDDGAEPIVIFAYHRSVMERLREEFPNSSYVIGGMTAKRRNEEVDKFQGGETNYFLGNLDAAGEAITLTRAHLLAFAEMDWRGTAMIQARKRIHRITQNQECCAYYLAAAKSFDSYITDSAFSKMENIQETLLFQ